MSTTDKRSVHTDALATLGTIISETEKRDAIHIAVEPVTAAHPLHPGDDVGFVEGGFGACDNPVGIVDPFLKGTVKKGQRFWLLVYPRQIQSLRHVWSHPAFGEEASQVESKSKEISDQWLRKFLDGGDPDYDEVMSIARSGGDVTSYGHDIEYKEIPEEFYDHLEVVTGREFVERPDYFRCAC